jgi:hypothetical protein
MTLLKALLHLLRVSEEQAAGIGCYQVSGKTHIYSLIGSGEEDLFVLDDGFNKNMILIPVARQIMHKLYEEPTANQHLLREPGEKTKVTVKKEVSYAGAEKKWESISMFDDIILNKVCSLEGVYRSDINLFKIIKMLKTIIF